MKHVIRFDIEVDRDTSEEVGEVVNQLIGFAVDVIEPEHYQWRTAQVDDGFDDPELEKMMSQAVMVG